MSNDDVRVPAGWYPDPLGLPQLRWWDNHAWTEHTSDARQPMVAETSPVEPMVAQPMQAARAETSRPRLTFADDLPYADDVDPADLAHPVHDLVEPSTEADAADLPSRRTLREAERLAHDDDGLRDLDDASSAFADPLPELEAPSRSSHVVAEPSPAARYARGAGIGDAPRSMRYDLEESHEDLLGEPSDPRSAFAHASSSTATFVPDYETEPHRPEASHTVRRTATSSVPRTSTVPAWLLTVIPIYMLLVGMMVLLSGTASSVAFVTIPLVLGVPWVAGIVLSIIDHRMLTSGGMERPAHWLWSILGAPVYLVARLVATVREAGTGFGPVLTYLVLGLFTVGSVVAVPGLVMVLAPATFAAEAERAVTDDATSLGANLTIDCPETLPLLTQQSFTCRATNAEGRSFDVLVSLQRSNGWIDWRVDNWGIFTGDS